MDENDTMNPTWLEMAERVDDGCCPVCNSDDVAIDFDVDGTNQTGSCGQCKAEWIAKKEVQMVEVKR